MANHLQFEFAETRFAIAAESIDAIHWLPALAAGQDLPAYFVGLMNLHGEILPVVDLARRFGRAARPCRIDQVVLVLRGAGRTVGVLADRVVEFGDIPVEGIEPYFQVEGASIAYSPSVIRGCIQSEAGVAIILDAYALLELMFDVSADASPEGEPAPEFCAGDPDALARLQARTEQLASPQVTHEDKPHWYALVTIGESHFALELSRVIEFAHLDSYTPVPCCPDHILGCINLRGAIITVLDVGPILLGEPSRDNREVVILQLSGQRVALAVHQVIDGAAYTVSATSELDGNAFAHPHARRLLRHDNGIAEVLDLDSLLREGLLEVKEQV